MNSEKSILARELGKHSPYEIWAQGEGVPLIKTFFVEDVRKLGLERWNRKGGRGALLNFEGAGGVNDCYVYEIAPGESLKPQRHLFEENVYIVSGRGATCIWQPDGKKVTFEWEAGSLFSPPLNSWYQHFNGSKNDPVRYVAVTTAPTVINMFHNLDFVFNNDFAFTDRFDGQDEYFSGKGSLYEGDYYGHKFSSRVWETNFVASVKAFTLPECEERGAGGKQIHFSLSENSTACHVSEFPVGTYKKAHHHGPGAHVIILSGDGYTLLWPQGESPKRYDWHEGSMIVPPDSWWHQHFNTGPEPARYLALRGFGSKKYRGLEKPYQGRKDRRLGGASIEYDDEDPMVREMFEAELAKSGLKSRMGPSYSRSKKTLAREVLE
jgi:quercetin dioxygenase-like cupin family protein